MLIPLEKKSENFVAMVILSALVKRFSVSRMQDLLDIIKVRPTFENVMMEWANFYWQVKICRQILRTYHTETKFKYILCKQRKHSNR